MLLNFTNFMCEESAETKGMPDWIVKSFPVINIVIIAVLAVLAIAMMVFVLMQKSDSDGMSAISGKTDTFYNKNKGATLQGKIRVLTIIDAVLILVLCLLFLVSIKIYNPYLNLG